LKIIKKLKDIFRNFFSGRSGKKACTTPLLIIKKEAEQESTQSDSDVKIYSTIEEAIADFENDPNVPADKIEKLKASQKNLKNKTVIKIKNGQIIK